MFSRKIGIIWPCPKIWSIFLCAKQTKCKNIYFLENHLSPLNPDFFLLHANLWTPINVTHILWRTHWKEIVKTFMSVSLKYDRKTKKKTYFITNTRASISLKLHSRNKLFYAKLGRKTCLRHQNISALLYDNIVKKLLIKLF